jgi:hypothetical protein
MGLGEVHVQHRLVNPLVAHPQHRLPGVHAEHRGVGPEGMAAIPSSA